MQFTCVVCGGNRAAPWLTRCRDTYLHEPGTVDYVRCEHCDLVQQDPIPASLEKLYESYPVHARKSRLHDVLRSALLGSAYFDAAGMASGHALLDVGCGDGWFLEKMKRRGLRCTGLELDADHAAQLAGRLGVPVHDSWASLLASERRDFDAVTLHFVLEHVSEPVQTLTHARQVLKHGGLAYVLIPNIRSWEARLFGRSWHGLDAPRHLIFPSDANMRELAARTGFAVERCRDVSFPNTLASSLSVWCTGHHRDWLFKASLPLALAVSRVAPAGSRAYYLRAIAI
jgi:2-polyprenyl-3-methyl-5-hydroxy-6-metoxy-1,4-benzoquinol methylase